MGLNNYWLLKDQEKIVRNRRRRKVGQSKEAAEVWTGVGGVTKDNSNIVSKLKLVQFKGLAVIYFCGVLFAMVCFVSEKFVRFTDKRACYM